MRRGLVLVCDGYSVGDPLSEQRFFLGLPPFARGDKTGPSMTPQHVCSHLFCYNAIPSYTFVYGQEGRTKPRWDQHNFTRGFSRLHQPYVGLAHPAFRRDSWSQCLGPGADKRVGGKAARARSEDCLGAQGGVRFQSVRTPRRGLFVPSSQPPTSGLPPPTPWNNCLASALRPCCVHGCCVGKARRRSISSDAHPPQIPCTPTRLGHCATAIVASAGAHVSGLA